ncbi:hypothetical protein LINPERPRIM_LOCUS16062 [Linum perenne]
MSTLTFRPILLLIFLNCVALISLSSIPSTQGIEFPITITSPNTSTGVQRFIRRIGKSYASRKMESATNFIWQTLHQTNSDGDRKDYRRIELLIQDMKQTVYHVDNRIAISAEYIGNYSAGNLKREFTGMLYNELVKVWAWNGMGQAPVGLVSGIADYVRMKARLETVIGWARPGDGQRWDQGDDVTARFLEYCVGFKEGFVGELNRKMKNGYSDDYFKELLGKSVDQVWKNYKARYP